MNYVTWVDVETPSNITLSALINSDIQQAIDRLNLMGFIMQNETEIDYIVWYLNSACGPEMFVEPFKVRLFHRIYDFSKCVKRYSARIAGATDWKSYYAFDQTTLKRYICNNEAGEIIQIISDISEPQNTNKDENK